MTVATGTLLELEDVCVDYVLRDRRVRAVDGVSLSVAPGETLGIAGESGCGKSTLANAILQILKPPAQLTSGRILFEGSDLAAMGTEAAPPLPVASRLARLPERDGRAEPASCASATSSSTCSRRTSGSGSRRRSPARATCFELVGIDRSRLRDYPHQLSGGMRQRVVIAMALALRPELIVLDEPTTALDVVVQREILQELEQLKAELGFAVIFITHDLSLLVEFSDRISIMYAGEIVETATADVALPGSEASVHVGLMSSFPPLTGPLERIAGIPGCAAEPRAAARGLPLQPALSALRRPRRGALRPADGRAAPAAGGRARALRRLSSRRGAGMSTATLEVVGLTKEFGRRPPLRAVDDVSFTLRPGTVTALVGESGSGKSDRREAPLAALRADRGHDPFPRRGRQPGPRPPRAARVPLRSADDLPGPVRVAEPGQEGPAPPQAAALDSPARAAGARSTRASASCS